MTSPNGADLYYVETFDRPSPLWRLPLSGGVATKVWKEWFEATSPCWPGASTTSTSRQVRRDFVLRLRDRQVKDGGS